MVFAKQGVLQCPTASLALCMLSSLFSEGRTCWLQRFVCSILSASGFQPLNFVSLQPLKSLEEISLCLHESGHSKVLAKWNCLNCLICSWEILILLIPYAFNQRIATKCGALQESCTLRACARKSCSRSIAGQRVCLWASNKHTSCSGSQCAPRQKLYQVLPSIRTQYPSRRHSALFVVKRCNESWIAKQSTPRMGMRPKQSWHLKSWWIKDKNGQSVFFWDLKLTVGQRFLLSLQPKVCSWVAGSESSMQMT